MDQPHVGHLERVAPSSVWKSEASEFLPWLAEPENLRRLGDALRFNLEPVARETQIGQFRADLLCRDRDTGARVVIEAQLGISDHRHLGQILTYARALRTRTVVWLAARFHAEHRDVLAQLNEAGDLGLNCFAVEMDMLKIGASPAAPQYSVVVEPREWPFPIFDRPGDETAGADDAPAGSPQDSPLRARRKRAGMSLRQLAKAAGISTGYLSHIEIGRKPGTPDIWAAIARALNAAGEADGPGAHGA
ncbi:MAG: helix-turn-helix domain-containing protein [Defluviicoccus sp.]|nr:helix-turn-helix domain-containing protein [Defluviicoccus sp.]MDE0386627.1 helix-turn-helix domain-containing protein [Defluviicoccus sp.]